MHDRRASRVFYAQNNYVIANARCFIAVIINVLEEQLYMSVVKTEF